MIFDGLSVFRRSATVPICVATLLGAGCAGSPLGFKNRATALTESPTSGAVAQADGSQSGVVTLDTIAKAPDASQQLQQTASTQSAAKPTGLPNFAGIFDAAAKTNQQPDPFAVAEAKQQPVTAQNLPSPADARTKISAGFDDSMAELARSGGASSKDSKAGTTPASNRNPFEPFADPSAGISKAKSTAITVPQGPTAKELEALLAKELAGSTTPPVRETNQVNKNPFADFVPGNTAVAKATKAATPKADSNGKTAYVTLDRLGSQKPASATQPNAANTDWIKEQTASLPAPSSPLNGQQTNTDPFAAATSERAADPTSVTKTRVQQLLDSSERALRAGRYGDAEKIAGDAFDLANTDSVHFDIGERTPSALLRRIASARRSAAKSASPAIDFLTDSLPEPEVASAAKVIPQKAKDAFGSFATVTTWQPVSEEGVEYTKPTAVEAATSNAASDQRFSWQASNGSRAGQDFVGTRSPMTSESTESQRMETPAVQTASLAARNQASATTNWSPKTQPESRSDIAQTSATATALTAPKWQSEPAAAAQAPWAQQQTSRQSSTQIETPSLPKLPKFGETVSSANTSFSDDLWGEDNPQIAMATMEIAPPAPMMIESADGSSEEPLNYGTLLALLTVIGLGLVAVLAFRTQPESLDA